MGSLKGAIARYETDKNVLNIAAAICAPAAPAALPRMRQGHNIVPMITSRNEYAVCKANRYVGLDVGPEKQIRLIVN